MVYHVHHKALLSVFQDIRDARRLCVNSAVRVYVELGDGTAVLERLMICGLYISVFDTSKAVVAILAEGVLECTIFVSRPSIP